MTRQSDEIRRLLWEAERIMKNQRRVRLMVSLGSRWIGRCQLLESPPVDALPSSWDPFMGHGRYKIRKRFSHGYQLWLASKNSDAIDECIEFAMSIGAAFKDKSLAQSMGAYGAWYLKIVGATEQGGLDVPVFAAAAEAAADRSFAIKQRDPVDRCIQLAGMGVRIKVRQEAGRFNLRGDRLKSRPGFEGWDDPASGYFIEAIWDAMGLLASGLHCHEPTSTPVTSAIPYAPLSDDHIRILRMLAQEKGRCLQIATLIAKGPSRDRGVVGRLLKYLENLGYVNRPLGPRKGRAITDAGLKYVQSIEPPAQLQR